MSVNCYPDSDVLISLLDIRDSDALEEAEAEFSFEHLKHLHYHLFQDLYEWAGQTRDVDISKGNTRFCTWTRIEPEANKLFRTIPALADCHDHDVLVEKIADLFCELNLLHPFREGNGRVLRFFFEEMLYTISYDVTWPKISQQDWIDANIAGVKLNLDLLKAHYESKTPDRTVLIW